MKGVLLQLHSVSKGVPLPLHGVSLELPGVFPDLKDVLLKLNSVPREL